MIEYKINIDEVKSNLVKRGYATLPSIKNYIKNKSFADEISKEIGNKNFIESSTLHLTLLKELDIESDLVPLLFSIAKENLNYKGSIDNQYHVSRKVIPGDTKECYRAHFDSHLFTIVFPLLIPLSNDQTPCGELMIFPNIRKNPKYEFQNIISKLWYKQYANKGRLNKLATARPMKIIDFHDYYLIIFRGNTFLHTNKELSNSVKHYRLTCLSHYFNTFVWYWKCLHKIRSR